MLGGEAGPAVQLASRLLARLGQITGADRLVPIVAAHVDGCLYHGPVSIDFARRLAEGGGRVRVQTTLTSVRSRAITFDYLITNAESGTRLATAHTALVSIDGDGRLAAIPPIVRDALVAAL